MNHKCILFVDFQRDFLEVNGRLPIGALRAEAILAKANLLLAAARAGRFAAIFIASEFSPTDRLGNILRRHSALRRSPGADIDPRIVAEGFPVFSKATSDAFSNPNLLAYLRRSEFNELAITGVMTEGCVRATTRSAVRHGFKVTVISDAVESDSNWKKRLGFWLIRRSNAAIESCEQFVALLPN
jgi:nicotinamidase-related amidase